MKSKKKASDEWQKLEKDLEEFKNIDIMKVYDEDFKKLEKDLKEFTENKEIIEELKSFNI